MNVPVIWVNRRGEKLDGRKKPDAEAKNFRDAAKKLGAGGSPATPEPTRRHRAQPPIPPTRRWSRERASGSPPSVAGSSAAAVTPSVAGALPNLIVIGGLKCGTTSLHHYLNLHPEVAMSRPKELNFFVAELNWELGPEWYASHFDRRRRFAARARPTTPTCPASAGSPSGCARLLGSARVDIHGP